MMRNKQVQQQINNIIIKNELYKNIELIKSYDKKNYKDFIRKYHVKKEDIEKFRNRYINRRYRVYKRILYMKDHYDKLYFVTYTINEKNMGKDHIRKLKEMYAKNVYLFNVDYGLKNNRKHYHGIVACEPIKWDYGFSKFEEIKTINEKELTKYIFKLSSHCLKKNTNGEKVIYSRKKCANS